MKHHDRLVGSLFFAALALVLALVATGCNVGGSGGENTTPRMTQACADTLNAFSAAHGAHAQYLFDSGEQAASFLNFVNAIESGATVTPSSPLVTKLAKSTSDAARAAVKMAARERKYLSVRSECSTKQIPLPCQRAFEKLSALKKADARAISTTARLRRNIEIATTAIKTKDSVRFRAAMDKFDRLFSQNRSAAKKIRTSEKLFNRALKRCDASYPGKS
jgi:hypothetical protein